MTNSRNILTRYAYHLDNLNKDRNKNNCDQGKITQDRNSRFQMHLNQTLFSFRCDLKNFIFFRFFC